MKTYKFEINGTYVKITTDETIDIIDLINELSKTLNSDDVNVEECIFTGKKKFRQEIDFNI